MRLLHQIQFALAYLQAEVIKTVHAKIVLNNESAALVGVASQSGEAKSAEIREIAAMAPAEDVCAVRNKLNILKILEDDVTGAVVWARLPRE